MIYLHLGFNMGKEDLTSFPQFTQNEVLPV